MTARYPIPSAALDDRLAITGTSGSGKTHDTGTAVERLLAAKSRVCVVDPLGVWWGLRLAADGKTPSKFKVVIFGGPHGDIAITETSGKLIGETIAGMTESCIVDLSEFETDASQRRFMLALLVALYNKLHGDLLHLVLDEADMWAPQSIKDKEGDATKLHHNMQKIVRRGRVKGFIPWLITQRPAELSKSVLSQVDGIVAHQLVIPHDINAIMDWVRVRADKATADIIHKGLPAFRRGEAAVYIPRRNVLGIAQFPAKATFDSSRSPERGEKKNRPDVALKPLDLDALKKRLEKVETEAKANDPAKLKSEIAQLRAANAKLEKGLPASKTSGFLKAAPGDKSVTDDTLERSKAFNAGDASGHKRGLQEGWERGATEGLRFGVPIGWRLAVDAMKRAIGDFRLEPEGQDQEALQRALLKGAPKRPKDFGKPTSAPMSVFPPSQEVEKINTPPRPAPVARPRAAAGGDASLTQPQLHLLAALAWWKMMGHDAPTRVQVAAIAGWTPRGSNLRGRLSELSTAGLVTYPEPKTVALTQAGEIAAPSPDPDQTLVEAIRAVLTNPQRAIFEVLLDRGGAEMPRADLAAALGWEAGGSNLRGRLSELSSLELVRYPGKGSVALQDWVTA